MLFLFVVYFSSTIWSNAIKSRCQTCSYGLWQYLLQPMKPSKSIPAVQFKCSTTCVSKPNEMQWNGMGWDFAFLLMFTLISLDVLECLWHVRVRDEVTVERKYNKLQSGVFLYPLTAAPICVACLLRNEQLYILSFQINSTIEKKNFVHQSQIFQFTLDCIIIIHI